MTQTNGEKRTYVRKPRLTAVKRPAPLEFDADWQETDDDDALGVVSLGWLRMLGSSIPRKYPDNAVVTFTETHVIVQP